MNIELKPIAESKVRQLGGDVCGVLVRTDGEVMAVSEHGRCTRLDESVMRPVAPAAMSERALFEQKFPAPQGVEWIDDNQGYRITSDDDYWWDSEGQAHFRAYLGQWIGWQAARAQSGQGVEPEGCDLPPGYSVRLDPATGWHWYDDVKDRTTDEVFSSKVKALVGAWKDYSLSRHFNMEELTSYMERNFDPYLAEKVHYSSGPDLRSWQLESFSLSTDAYNPKPFPDCLGEFFRRFLSTPTTPQADGWVRCDERLPTEEDWWVWIYDSEDGDIFHALWRDLKGDYENGHMNLSHWMPTGLKRPQPPQEGA